MGRLAIAINLDLHFSDTWADPSNQATPQAWKDLEFTDLRDSVYNYTINLLRYFEEQNLTPEFVQLGNETNQGMLFPLGRVSDNDWRNFGELLRSGIQAVRDFSDSGVTIKPKIILHVAQFQIAEWWANGIVNIAGINFMNFNYKF